MDQLVNSIPGIIKDVVIPKVAEIAAEKKIIDYTTADLFKPQLDKIQNAIAELQRKDFRAALVNYDDALRALELKYNNYSCLGEINLKRQSEDVKAKLDKAQESAVEAVAAGTHVLKTAEYLETYRLILATELLKVFNEATSATVVSSDHLEWVQLKLSEAKGTCFENLTKVNEIPKIQHFIATKIPEYKNPINPFSGILTEKKEKKRTDQVVNCLELNLDVARFFHVMARNYGDTFKRVNGKDFSGSYSLLFAPAGAIAGGVGGIAGAGAGAGAEALTNCPKLMDRSPKEIAEMLFKNTKEDRFGDVAKQFENLSIEMESKFKKLDMKAETKLDMKEKSLWDDHGEWRKNEDGKWMHVKDAKKLEPHLEEEEEEENSASQGKIIRSNTKFRHR